MQWDRLLVQAEREIEDGEPWSAVVTFERILDLCEEHALQIPAEFWFRQAGVLQGAGLHERAVEASTRYLQEAGREGEHYRAALELLDAAEVDLAEARRAGARAEREIAAAIPEMVVIPAGMLRMGCLTRRGCEKWEMPVRGVHVSSFALAKHELTFAQWDVCTEYGPCRSVPDEGWGRGDRPVANVSFDDVEAYLGWLSRETGESYRLPSEAEWEYAARAGTETRYRWGDDIGTNRANCEGCGSRWDDRQTARVGYFVRTCSACTTCTATCGSGWQTAATTVFGTRRPMAAPGLRGTATDAVRAAVPGAASRVTSGLLNAAASSPPTGGQASVRLVRLPHDQNAGGTHPK